MKPRKLIFALHLLTSCLLVGCAVTDITRQPRFSWFVPGRVYAIKREVMVLIFSNVAMSNSGILYNNDDDDPGYYHDYPKTRPKSTHFVAPGTHIALTRVLHICNLEDDCDDYYARIIDGPYRGTEVSINSMLLLHETGVDPKYLVAVE